jgi:hypothetical protein
MSGYDTYGPLQVRRVIAMNRHPFRAPAGAGLAQAAVGALRALRPGHPAAGRRSVGPPQDKPGPRSLA